MLTKSAPISISLLDVFSSSLDKGLAATASEKYACGLCPSCQNLTETDIAARFHALDARPHVREIDMWAFWGDGPDTWQDLVPQWELYWPFMAKWLASP